MEKNPNPRTWRRNGLIIDLEHVAAIMNEAESGITNIYLVNAGAFQQAGSVAVAGPMRVKIEEVERRALIDAFEIYRTER